jgi:hypothetical protein
MRTTARLVVILALAAMVAGCGYRHVSQAEHVVRTIAVTRVDNPTLITQLGQQLRSTFHDEILLRQSLRFADKGAADAHVRLTIVYYELSSRIEGADDETLKFDVTATLRAKFRRRDDASLIWDSGDVPVTRTFTAAGEEQARDEALAIAMRRLVDSMYEAY